MQLKSRDDVSAAIAAARGVAGFSAADDPTDEVMARCAGVAAVHADFAAIPVATIIALAMQLLPIIFGEGGFTLEKLMSVLTLIQSIFA